MNLAIEDLAPVGSVWRQEDGILCKVVAHTRGDACWVWVRHANGRGNTWQVSPAWFETWERTS